MLKSVKPHILGKRGEKMGKLTKRDKEILDFIKNYMLVNGTTPTIREIGEAVELYSTNSVYAHFQKLISLGYITQIADKRTTRYRVRGMKYTCDETFE